MKKLSAGWRRQRKKDIGLPFLSLQTEAHIAVMSTKFGLKGCGVWQHHPLISVALRYIDGKAAPQDIEKDVAILMEMADKGIGNAKVALEEHLITGKDVSMNTDKALNYLTLAAEAGYAAMVSGLGITLIGAKRLAQ